MRSAGRDGHTALAHWGAAAAGRDGHAALRLKRATGARHVTRDALRQARAPAGLLEPVMQSESRVLCRMRADLLRPAAAGARENASNRARRADGDAPRAEPRRGGEADDEHRNRRAENARGDEQRTDPASGRRAQGLAEALVVADHHHLRRLKALAGDAGAAARRLTPLEAPLVRSAGQQS